MSCEYLYIFDKKSLEYFFEKYSTMLYKVLLKFK